MAGFKEKLILLPSYTEIATGISELELPVLDIPGLFMPEKLSNATHSNTSTPGKIGTVNRVESPEQVVLPSSPRSPPSYSTILRTTPPRKATSTPDLDCELSSDSSDDTDEILSRAPTVAMLPNLSRRINPHLVRSVS